MVRSLLVATLVAAAVLACTAAGPSAAATSKGAPDGAAVLHQREVTSFGVYYYPEQWPQREWKGDFERMAKLGFRFTHMGEFSWAFLEPQPGKFDFKWLDDAIALAHAAGLRVILCTPSAAMPVWMGQRHPGVFRVEADGQRQQHGIRAEASLANPVYRKFVAQVVTAMADRYGHDPRVWGWQIDNEPSTFPDYSASAEAAFRRWLEQKYATIDALNASWGGAVWSLHYDDFAQVQIPNVALQGEDKLSPNALLDFAEYQADTTAGFLDMQAKIIREHASPAQWITTNYTNVTTAGDPRLTHDLTFPSFTMYPVAGANVLGGDSYAIGDPTRMMEAVSYFRPITGTFGVMELQPGQVNWASINPQPAPGAVGMWMWHAFAAGASFIATYRFRRAHVGSEMYHEGIIGTDGVTLSRTGREYVDTLRRIEDFEGKLDSKATLPSELAARRTGILWSQKNYWALEIQPQTSLWHTWKYRNTFTEAVMSTGAPMDFIGPDDDFDRYPVIVAPAYLMVGAALADKWKRYVEEGGHLILTSRSGELDANGHMPDGKWAAPILNLIGDDIDGFDVLPPSATGEVSMDGQAFGWHRWADILVPRPGTRVLATYDNHYYRGMAAATTRTLGKGTVTYIGVSTDSGELERKVIRAVYQRAGIAIRDLPKGVYLYWRGGYDFMVNYNPKPFTPELPGGAEIVVGKVPLEPAQVLVWKDRPRGR